MTTATVSSSVDALQSVAGAVQGISGIIRQVAKAESVEQDVFESVISKVNSQFGAGSGQADISTGYQAVTSQIANADHTNKSSLQDMTAKADHANRSSVKSSQTKKAESPEKDQTVADDQKQAIETAAEQVVADVAEEMNVPVEDVEEAMEALGFEAVDLLNGDNMKELLTMLTGSDDVFSIVTDGELYGHLQNLMEDVTETLQDLAQDLGLDAEDLQALLTDMQQMQTTPVTETDALPGMQDADIADDTAQSSLEGLKDYTVTVHRDGETVEMKVTVDDATGETDTAEKLVDAAPKAESQSESQSKSGKDTSGDEADARSESHAATITTTAPQTVEQPLTAAIAQTSFADTYADTQAIMDQILDYMKVSVREDVQQLQMQLHPESLGTLNIQITAKDGMLTAQFTAQNEVVRAAIETQLVILKEQFEEQGLKVDAVEVTVANYGTDQKFSENNEENADGEQAKGSKGMRRINLDELDADELPEDMEESERIAVEMMAANGNTVDYTA